MASWYLGTINSYFLGIFHPKISSVGRMLLLSELIFLMFKEDKCASVCFSHVQNSSSGDLLRNGSVSLLEI